MACHDHSVCTCAPAACRRVRALLTAAFAVAAITAASRAVAQYDSIAPQINAAQAAQLVAKVTSVMRAPQAAPADLKVIDEYFIKYFFPMMTSDDPEQLAALIENKEKLLRQFINIRGVTPAAQKYLIDRTAAVMRAVASGAKGKNYHPAVRYNAALILGQLDQAAAAGGNPPVPLAAATGDLLGLLEGETIPTPVKVAALVGLERHTRFGADAQYADRIAKSVLAIATSKKAPEDASTGAFDWTRCLAARVLVNQFAKGGMTAPVHNALVELIGSKQLNMDDRCKVAEALSATMYEGAQGVDAEPMVRALGQLAQDVLATEGKDAQKYIDAMLGGGAAFSIPMEGGRGGGGGGGIYGGRGGGGGYGRGGELGGRGGGFGGEFDPTAMEAEQGPRYERRRLLDRILAICAGGRATSGGASDEVKQQIDALVTPLQDTADFAASKDAGDAEVTDMVVELATEVNRVVGSWGGAAEPAAAAAEEDALDAAAAEAPAAEAPAAEQPAAEDAAAEAAAPAESTPAAAEGATN